MLGRVRDPLTFMELRLSNLAMNEEVFEGSVDAWSPQDWACAAAGEMGEACNLIKKMRRGESIPVQDVADEIADTVIYLDLLAARLNISLAAAIRRKFNVVSDRKGATIRL